MTAPTRSDTTVVAQPAETPPGTSRSAPVFPEDRLIVRSWHDPVLDNLGHDPRSPYVEQFWLAVLGPSCLFLVRRLAARLERAPDGFELDPLEWARELGLGMKGGKHGPFWRAVDRACRFQLAQRERRAVRRAAPDGSADIPAGQTSARQPADGPPDLARHAASTPSASIVDQLVGRAGPGRRRLKGLCPKGVGVLRSVGAVAAQHGRNRPQHDRQVDHHRPVVHVVQVEAGVLGKGRPAPDPTPATYP